MITMATNKEYNDWKNDPVAQQEYKHYLLKEIFKTDPVDDPNQHEFMTKFTEEFIKLFKESK